MARIENDGSEVVQDTLYPGEIMGHGRFVFDRGTNEDFQTI